MRRLRHFLAMLVASRIVYRPWHSAILLDGKKLFPRNLSFDCKVVNLICNSLIIMQLIPWAVHLPTWSYIFIIDVQLFPLLLGTGSSQLYLPQSISVYVPIAGEKWRNKVGWISWIGFPVLFGQRSHCIKYKFGVTVFRSFARLFWGTCRSIPWSSHFLSNATQFTETIPGQPSRFFFADDEANCDLAQCPPSAASAGWWDMVGSMGSFW